jgi:phosphocarrier protein HPr
MNQWVNGSAVISIGVGLHARPSVRLTKLAKSFQSHVEVMAANGDDWVNAKSIVKVMRLKANSGIALNVRARGTDSEAAVAAIVAFVRRNFDEGAGHALSA